MSEPNKMISVHQVLSEELLRWIGRTCEAEKLVAELSIKVGKQQDEIERHKKLYAQEERADAAWAREVGAFLKEALTPPFNWNMGEASRLFTDGIVLGIIPEPDCRQAKTWRHVESTGGVEEICPKCGGRKI